MCVRVFVKAIIRCVCVKNKEGNIGRGDRELNSETETEAKVLRDS